MKEGVFYDSEEFQERNAWADAGGDKRSSAAGGGVDRPRPYCELPRYHTFSFVKVQTSDPLFEQRIKTLDKDIDHMLNGFPPKTQG